MRRLFLAAAFTGAVFCAAHAAAQTPAATPVPAPAGLQWFVGGIGGAGSVQTVFGVVGAELGVALNDKIAVFGEGLWMGNVVTRRRLALADTVAAYLQTSQGKAATGDVVAPATYGGGGVRVLLARQQGAEIYGTFSVGAAHVALQPVFTLGGADVTTSLAQYGVTLGRDLSHEVTVAAFGGGAGVRIPRGRWYLDGGLRVTSIRTADQPTNALRAIVTVGMTF